MRARRSWFGPQLAALLGAGAASLALPTGAGACPRCATADAVWATAFGPTLWPNLLATAAPFAVLAAVALACHRIGARRPPGRRAEP